MSTQVESSTASSSGTGAANPFIGLRRFEMEDSDLFFGRDEQTHELLRRLRMLHFVAVMGPSGCGKSSLIRAGVLAALRDGYLLGDDDEEWQIVITQPGNGPLEAWVRDLQPVKRAGAADAELLVNPVAAIDTSRGPVVLLVDQFEELFQFAERTGRQEDAREFIKALLATGAAGGRVYAILTMRSEYLAHCAQHALLSEAINEGVYLVPYMRPEQLRDAIVRPVHKSGAAITTELVDRLLQDVTDESDSLPILQHALMRMWGKKRPFEPLGLYAYEEERGFGAFITDHAEDVYKKLTPEQQKAAERLFQTITEQGPEGRAVRRPLEIDGIAEKTGLDTKLLESAIRPFQAEGFLIVTPSPRAPSPLVDISHEAIARQWWRLGPGRSEQGRMVEGWITKEGRFRRWVRQIEDAAKAHEQSGKDNAFLYRGLQLTLAEEAVRGRDRELSEAAMLFLRTSRTREDRLWFLSKKFLVPASAVFAVVAGFALFATQQRQKAVQAEHLANVKIQEQQLRAMRDLLAEQERGIQAVTLARDSSAPVAPGPSRELRAQVYIQYRDESQRDTAQRIQKTLGDLPNFRAPGIELLPVGPAQTEIRYFDSADEDLAIHVQGVVEAVTPEMPKPVVQLVRLKDKSKIRAKHLEVWLALPPGKQAAY